MKVKQLIKRLRYASPFGKDAKAVRKLNKELKKEKEKGGEQRGHK